MKTGEQAFLFSCAGEALLGIACIPEMAASTGIVVAVGGPQYRVGSHRQFLLLSRSLARAGFPVLRFDFRGMGDSSGAMRDFEAVEDDIGAAIDAFVARYPGIERIVLWGLCDAASASLLYWEARRDPRVYGMCLLNPWVRSEASLARTHVRHYYGQRLLQSEFWTKLLSGKADIFGAAAGLFANLRLTRKGARAESRSFQGRMASALGAFAGPVLLVLSGNDYTAKEFLQYAGDDPAWEGLLARPQIATLSLPEADHTFSSANWRDRVAQGTVDWLNRSGLEPGAVPSSAGFSGNAIR
ncbi:MAG: hydrolase 1, exosortase A system-associated [Dechloromonas sp.]|jgi:exosortase A-associated hydrolase 1|nr:hydrolase 1, exosortase A system-associated [Dechloromonas sp.]